MPDNYLMWNPLRPMRAHFCHLIYQPQALSKCLSKWIKVDKWDYFHFRSQEMEIINCLGVLWVPRIPRLLNEQCLVFWSFRSRSKQCEQSLLTKGKPQNFYLCIVALQCDSAMDWWNSYLLQFLSYRYILFMLGTCLQNITGGMLPVLFLAHRRDATSV